jgi:glycerol-3-phosphate dehydrogenase subunit C
MMPDRNIWEAETDIDFAAHTPVELTLDNCIKCNICVTACPVAAVTDLFPGPKYEAPQAGRFRKPQQHTPDHSVDYCSGCRVCNMVCPTGVRIAEINARARARIVEQKGVPPFQRLRNNLLARSELVGKTSRPVAPLANGVLGRRAVRWVMSKSIGIAPKAPLPSFSRSTFSSWFRQHPRPEGATRKVVFFHGCAAEYYEPRVAKAAVQVLEANGFEVLVPEQNCCGLPLLSNGEFPAAASYHNNNVEKMVGYVRDGYVIVGASTSCILTLKEEAPEMLDIYTPDARLLSHNTFDINEFLLHLYESGEMDVDNLRPIPLRLAYHMPCQYRAHRIGRPSAEILELIPELEIMESEAACCGIAGTYGFKNEKYDIAMAVGKPLFDFVLEVNGPVSVCDSETCRWQITRATGVPSVHPIELLAAAYGYPVEPPLAGVLAGVSIE